MNVKQILTAVTLSCAVTLMIGCGGETEQSAPTPSPATAKPATTSKAKDPQPVAAPVVDAAAIAAEQASKQIENIKSLLADTKYSEALNTLNEVSALKLTPEQQKLVSELKAQIDTALQSQAKAAADAAAAAAQAKAKAAADAVAAAEAKAKAAAEAAADELSNQTSSDIETIKGLIANKKYPEALNAIKALPALKLTPEQQKLVADLKAQIDAAMQARAVAQEPTKAVGELLGN